MKIKQFAFIFSLAIVVVLANSCSKSDNKPATPISPSGNSIDITGMTFPATTTVVQGTTVVWNNKDAVAHTVTSNDGTSFTSGSLNSGDKFSYVANTVGSFPYHCNFHSGMTGTLKVTAP